jgi:hypothetical protein
MRPFVSFHKWQLIVATLVIATLIGSASFFLAAKTQAAPVAQAAEGQPIAFNHQAMVQLGVQCLFCHADAQRSPSPGMPSVERCYGCHKTISTNLPVIQQVLGYWQRQEPIPWARVNTLPRFVYFSHEVHINVGGLACERCHGDVGHMTVARPVVRMNMGWCLSCHESQPNAAQLTDCVVCHQ